VQNYDDFNNEDKQYLSMFLHYYGTENNDMDISRFNDYEDIIIKTNDKLYKFSELLKLETIKLIDLNDTNLYLHKDKYDVDIKL